MPEHDLQLFRTLAFVGALCVALLAQRLWPHSGVRRSGRSNIVLWLVASALSAIVCGACGFAVADYAVRNGIGVLSWLNLPQWCELVLAVLALDLVSYGWHRANHRIPALWRFHQVHHSDDSFTVSTGLRFHPGEILLSFPLRLVGIVLVGASPLAVLVFEAFFTLSNLIEHGDIQLPDWVENDVSSLLVVPALHRRHHSERVEELNSNFGTIFSLWDKAFGTFGASSSTDKYRAGLRGIPAKTTSGLLLMPLRVRGTYRAST